MWILNNDTPFAAERTLVCDKDGRDVWVVAVKGAFLINEDGTTSIAKEQEDIVLFPKHIGDPAESSLLYECDLDYTKPGTDILLHGHAHAPEGKAVRQLNVGFRVSGLKKSLRVFGDRIWESRPSGFSLSEPEPFASIPIIYENAFGGRDDLDGADWDVRNPVGTGFAKRKDHLIGQYGPNVEHPSQLIRMWRDRPAPAGFGPIARHWSPRTRYVGTYDEKWEQERQPLLPLDFDELFFQCAPQDQQLGAYLKGGEPVEIINLTAAGRLQFTIPRVYLAFVTRFKTEAIRSRGVIHTVVLEPDVPRVLVVWHVMVPCQGRKDELLDTEVFRKELI